MKIDVLLGLQWGDEGKGKNIDVLAKEYDIIARFQGGPNAGHTLEFNEQKHVLHIIPSGVFHQDKLNLIGNGVVADPIGLKKEIEGLLPYISIEELKKRIVISNGAHIILPTHRLLDAAHEAEKGASKIGSTLKGIGPTYTDKISRIGIPIGDIKKADFATKYAELKKKHRAFGYLDIHLGSQKVNSILKTEEKLFFEAIEFLKSFEIVDGPYWLDKQLKAGKKILAEGAQGTLLDIDFGSYPFVTSSSTACGGVCTGLGISPKKIGKVYGLFKAYCTRVGNGPFPTELFDQTGELLQKKGNEFGATTGRARRCGWLDMPLLKYACMINGVTDLIISKADVLSDFETVKVAEHYLINGEIKDEMFSETPASLEIQYKEFKGWGDLTAATSISDLPKAFKEYIDVIERETQIPITMISTGPDREQIIIRKKES